jgi:acetylornithine aminotransferase
VALAVLDVLERENLHEKAAVSGEHLLNILRNGLAGKAGVRDIRGLGLLLAVELDRPCGELVMMAAEKGVLINVTARNVVRLLPPLVCNESELQQIGDVVIEVVSEFLEQ